MHAGLILIIQPVVQSALSPVAGVLADKCNPAWLANTGMAVCAVGLWGFGFVGQHTPCGLLVGCLLLWAWVLRFCLTQHDRDYG